MAAAGMTWALSAAWDAATQVTIDLSRISYVRSICKDRHLSGVQFRLSGRAPWHSFISGQSAPHIDVTATSYRHLQHNVLNMQVSDRLKLPDLDAIAQAWRTARTEQAYETPCRDKFEI